ncbi:hypothetical protein LSCM1_06895 [Leishmania martiniquensis]|uniref:Uncharacterized protein n=1 Tax=Leishmania martiniquensis TaxID=1580590 RepID=A0A836HUL2_9TRYP|nr:hypothetical protein LSCM1_06895 [Leishmania martiniquensis]
MPSKKKDFVYSIDPELYARSRAPAKTIAMGMKSSHASSLCWVDQVRREEQIREMWGATHDTKRSQERVTQAVQRTRARDVARHEAYVHPDKNPELYSILYKRPPPSSLRDSAAAVAPSSSPQLSTAAIAPTGTWKGPVDPSGSAFSRTARSTTHEYLQARCSHHTLQERYPNGPATAAQAVGWATCAPAEASTSLSAAPHAVHHPARHRQIGAYRKPEDDEHALLLGYD